MHNVTIRFRIRKRVFDHLKGRMHKNETMLLEILSICIFFLVGTAMIKIKFTRHHRITFTLGSIIENSIVNKRVCVLNRISPNDSYCVSFLHSQCWGCGGNNRGPGPLITPPPPLGRDFWDILQPGY